MLPAWAMVFPGQGSQSLGMLQDFALNYPQVIATFNEASEALGYDLWHMVQAQEVKLNQTEYTQPALLTASVALWRLWQAQNGPRPQIMAGHSLGEYTALVCANALTLKDAVVLVATRGRLMQAAVAEGQGAMAAIIGLNSEQITAICAEASEGEIVAPANYNAIGQVVIAGQVAAVMRAIEMAKAASAKMAKLLAVSVPSHCLLMQTAAVQLAAYLANLTFYKPEIPIINNVDVAIVAETAAIKDALVRQLTQPVRWVEIVQALAQQQIHKIVECGPGKVLAGLHKRIEPVLPTFSLGTTVAFTDALQQF